MLESWLRWSEQGTSTNSGTAVEPLATLFQGSGVYAGHDLQFHATMGTTLASFRGELHRQDGQALRANLCQRPRSSTSALTKKGEE